MTQEYPCVYFENGKCKKLSDDVVTSYCVMGPCSYQTLSNADRIRDMSDEQLSDLLDKWYCMGADGNDQLAYEDARMEWLQKPAEEANNVRFDRAG